MSKAIIVNHIDGSFYATPEDSIEAGLLNGMIEASRWAARTGLGAVAWDEITDRFVKGHALASGERIYVAWAELPLAAEEALEAWLFEFENTK